MIGLLTLELHIPSAQSLKDKRHVVKSIIGRIRARHNVSVAELEQQDIWQQAVVGVAIVSSAKTVVDQTFSAIVRLTESHGEAELVRVSIELL